MEDAVVEALDNAPAGTRKKIKGISVDTTGSTPVAVDRAGTPLALIPGFEENPNAMFVLWKDHTAVQEAEEINQPWHEPGADRIIQSTRVASTPPNGSGPKFFMY